MVDGWTDGTDQLGRAVGTRGLVSVCMLVFSFANENELRA